MTLREVTQGERRLYSVLAYTMLLTPDTYAPDKRKPGSPSAARSASARKGGATAPSVSSNHPQRSASNHASPSQQQQGQLGTYDAAVSPMRGPESRSASSPLSQASASESREATGVGRGGQEEEEDVSGQAMDILAGLTSLGISQALREKVRGSDRGATGGGRLGWLARH